jgi:eukaryotic-like serine/threonine-protein kinase
VTDIPLPPADYLYPRLSPDGRTLAYTESDHLWTYDLTRDAPPRKLTFEGINFWPVWKRDGRTIAFTSNRAGVPNLYMRIADGSAPEERVGTSPNPQTPHDWSPDGSVLASVDNDPVSDMDLFLLTVGDRTARPFIKTSARETSAAFSPDGSWVAYQSNASGQMEIYVTPYPAGRPQFQVSTGGGTEPLWSPGGKRLYYRRDDDVLQVDVDTRDRSVTAGRAVVVFRGAWYATGRVTGTLSYGVSPDDQRFLMIQDRSPAQPHTLELLVNALSKR